MGRFTDMITYASESGREPTAWEIASSADAEVERLAAKRKSPLSLDEIRAVVDTWQGRHDVAYRDWTEDTFKWSLLNLAIDVAKACSVKDDDAEKLEAERRAAQITIEALEHERDVARRERSIACVGKTHYMHRARLLLNVVTRVREECDLALAADSTEQNLAKEDLALLERERGGEPALERSSVVLSHYLSGDHVTYRNMLRDGASDVELGQVSPDVLRAIVAESGARDGDEVEIFVVPTGRRPFGDRRVRLASPNTYEREPRASSLLPVVDSEVCWIGMGERVKVASHWEGCVDTQTKEPVQGFNCSSSHGAIAFRMSDEGKTWRRPPLQEKKHGE